MRRTFWVTLLACVAASYASAQPPSGPTPQPISTYSSAHFDSPPSTPIAGKDGVAADSRTLCNSPGRAWLEAEFLLWFPRGESLPPLVTTGPLGATGTTVLFGNQTVNDTVTPGARLRAGIWCDCDSHKGIEGSAVYLASASTAFRTNTSLNPTIARPFFNATTGAQDALNVIAPGGISIDAKRDDFYSGDVNARCNLCAGCIFRVDFLGGFRYMHLSESLWITQSVTATGLAALVPIGTAVTFEDHFRTQNNYYGGQVGLAGEFRLSRFVAGFRALVGLGELHRLVDIGGSTGIAVAGQLPVTTSGGVLATVSNSTNSMSDQLAFASEYGASVGYQVTDHLRASVGYSLLYLTHVVRPANQIDLTVDPATGRPQFALHTSDFWVQGINFGLELRH